MKSIASYSNLWDSDPIINGDFITDDGITGYFLPGMYENSKKGVNDDQD